MADSRYELYTKRQYFDTLTDKIKHAAPNSRILLMAMTFEPDESEIAQVFDALEFAAQKGAVIYLGVDARSFLYTNGKKGDNALVTYGPGPLWFHSSLPEKLGPPYAIKQKRLNRLRQYPNIHVTVTNMPERPFGITVAGRSHIKVAVIDDFVMLGGCNLDSPDYIDIMVGWSDNTVADTVYELFSNALLQGNIRHALHGIDQIIPLDDSSEIYIDAGVPGQSRILEEALRLIDSANHWLTITCQFFPNSITAQHLLKARNRGVAVEILYANLRNQGPIGGSIQLVSQAIERLRVPKEMFANELPRNNPMIHAKLIASDAGVMIGSHNYVNAGVRLGTAEIAFRSTDKALAQAARDKITDQIIRK